MSQALRALGARVEIHDDHFPSDTRDAVWLQEVGRRGWVVLMKDKRIRRNRLERDALVAAGVRAFVLTSGNLTGPEMAEILVGHLPRMNRILRGNTGPFVAVVGRFRITMHQLGER